MKFLIINGPNLNMLGIREPQIYGTKTYEDLCEFCKKVAADKKVDVDIFQSNHEGAIVDAIQDAYGKYDGIIINPAAYTHTSIAIADAIKAVGIPTVEVHLSDVENREDYRKVSYIRDTCIRFIWGQGFEGYRVAMAALIFYLVKVPNPYDIKDDALRFDSFENGKYLPGKRNGRLPAMGWNSWNAFGTNNNEKLTRAMADKMIELELDKLGYKYVVLDDGCYKPERVDGRLTNETERFPGGFEKLSDYIHDKGLLFGMYNDVGTNLCSGAEVGTYGHETEDAENYGKWKIDYLKVDNCYYMWDDATFSDRERVRYVFTPNIRKVNVSSKNTDIELEAAKDGILKGDGAKIVRCPQGDYVTHIGTFDGTAPDRTPIGAESSELWFEIEVPQSGEYDLKVEYATGSEVGTGFWLQLAVGEKGNSVMYYDGSLPVTEGKEKFVISDAIKIKLREGKNIVRIMNHRRQENTLCSYNAMLQALRDKAGDRDIVLSLCEWGKNQPQNWAYKVGESWRILNDITFCVGDDGFPGKGDWKEQYTNSITSQYNKAVIMDEFSGLDKGWNDPDMMVIGMNGLDENMNKTHMAMWCMMNAPLMLGLDLRRVNKGDSLYKIIANKELIALNQDALGIQAKRLLCRIENEAAFDSKERFVYVDKPDKEYVRDINRVDVLVKPLANGDIAVSFINVSEKPCRNRVEIDVHDIIKAMGDKLADVNKWKNAKAYRITNLWTGASRVTDDEDFGVDSLEACGNVTVRISAE